MQRHKLSVLSNLFPSSERKGRGHPRKIEMRMDVKKQYAFTKVRPWSVEDEGKEGNPDAQLGF